MSMGMHSSERDWNFRRQQEPGRLAGMLDSARTSEELDSAMMKAKRWLMHYSDLIVEEAYERAVKRRRLLDEPGT